MVALLLEVGTEELPASFVQSALQQWQRLIPAALDQALLTPHQIRTFGTPRRLAVLITGLPERQPDRTEEIKGPPVQIAYKHGELTQAGQGFARKQGVEIDALEVRETDKGSFLFAIQSIEGQPVAQVLQQILPGWITDLTGERLMRWGSGELRFPRPIRWLTCLLDDRILPLELEGLRADRISLAHRVLHPEPLSLGTATEYPEALIQGYVQPDVDQRRHSIHAQIQQVAQNAGGIPEIPADLLEEVTQLVEWPTAVLGQFDPEFLQLPPQVIKIVMVTHQRYFPVYSQTDPEQLLPHFITLSNGDPEKSQIIAAGNGRVVRARLADAQFFYQEDRKHKLEALLEKLAQVTFVEELGSMAAKVSRIEQIAAQIASQLQCSPTDQHLIQRTAHLCKADLVSQMVFEFPELQGIVGADYARQDGEDPAVVEGIAQHYWPMGAGDPLPNRLTGQVVGLADRIDSLVGLFQLGRIPSGSSDRFALRRAATSMVLILWESGLPLDLDGILKQAVETYAADDLRSVGDHQPQTHVLLQEFFCQRISTLLQEEKGIDYDLVSAVVGEPGSDLALRSLKDLNGALKRATYLQQLRDTGVLAELYPTLNRTARLAQQGDLGLEVIDPEQVIDPNLFQDPSEAALYQVCRSVYERGQQAEAKQEFQPLIEAFQAGATTVTTFFEAVLVMDKDPQIKANRLNLLGVLRNNARILADFGAVVMAGEA